MTSTNRAKKQIGIGSRAWKVAKDKGVSYLFIAAYRRMRNKTIISFWHNYYRLFKSRKKFVFQGRKLRYFYHKYNTTWVNERAIEIPIIQSMIMERNGRILEIGNVLSHYFKTNHEIVDKYEQGEYIITQDVTEISLPKQYDLIISISTLEHVGWDENPTTHKITNESQKILCAIDKLRELVKPNGRIVFTMPLGYNPNVDLLIRNRQLHCTQQFFLKRISKDNRWEETTWENVEHAKFNNPFPFGNALIVGIVDLG